MFVLVLYGGCSEVGKIPSLVVRKKVGKKIEKRHKLSCEKMRNLISSLTRDVRSWPDSGLHTRRHVAARQICSV